MKYLVKPIAEQQTLEDYRDDFLNNYPDVCIKHETAPTGCHYPEVQIGIDTLEVMLCVHADAEQHLTAGDQAALETDLPTNFIFLPEFE
mgnify:CR=1 FL=1